MASVEKQLLGTETVRAMRARGVQSIICGLSANDMRDNFLDAGADAFCLKPLPCKANDLRQALQEVWASRIANNNNYYNHKNKDLQPITKEGHKCISDTEDVTDEGDDRSTILVHYNPKADAAPPLQSDPSPKLSHHYPRSQIHTKERLVI